MNEKPTRDNTHPPSSMSTAAEADPIKAHLKKCSDALLKVRPLGGSELFVRVYDKDGENYYADPEFCGAEIDRLRQEVVDLKKARANSSALAVPEGWKLVPVEATVGMAIAGQSAHDGELPDGLPATIEDIYRAMLSAAPSPPAPGGWRTMETAPRDGRMALVYRPLAHMSGDQPVAIKRLIGEENYCWEKTVPAGQKPCNPTDGACHVTHWLPLPAPPATPQPPVSEI